MNNDKRRMKPNQSWRTLINIINMNYYHKHWLNIIDMDEWISMNKYEEQWILMKNHQKGWTYEQMITICKE